MIEKIEIKSDSFIEKIIFINMIIILEQVKY